MAVAELADAAQIAVWVDEHPRGALDERLHDHGGQRAGVLGEQAFHVVEIAGLRLERVEEERPVEGVEELDAAHGDRADRVAVVGVSQSDEAGPALAALVPVLVGHLERDLGGGGAGVRVEDARQAGRSDLDEPSRQVDRRGVAEAEHGGVGDPVKLVAQRGVDARMAVPVDVAPERGDAVDVAVAVDVDEVGTLRALDDQLLLLLPAALLRERMPEVCAVRRLEIHEVVRH